MRTREEQIEDLAILIEGCCNGPPYYAAEKIILEAEQRVRAEIGRDSERLDWLEDGCCDVRFRSEPIADTGDADTYCDIVEHHMSDPKERVVGSSERLRAAIDAAREGE